MGQLYKKHTFLVIPENEIEEAKKAGAKLDKQTNLYYAPRDSDVSVFSKWEAKTPEQKAIIDQAVKQALSKPPYPPKVSNDGSDKIEIETYLVVSGKKQVDELKAKAGKGVFWDKEKSLWVAKVGTPKDAVEKWLPENAERYLQERKTKYYDAVERSTGFNIGSEIDKQLFDLQTQINKLYPTDITASDLTHILDGERHRFATDNSKHKKDTRFWLQGSIAEDGRVTCTFGSWDDGGGRRKKGSYFFPDDFNLKSNYKYLNLNPNANTEEWLEKEKAYIDRFSELIRKAKKEQKKIAEERAQAFTAKQLNYEFSRARPASQDNNYLKKKGISPHNTKEDFRKNLIVPFYDMANLGDARKRDQIVSTQRIWDNGNSKGKMIGKATPPVFEYIGFRYMAKSEGCYNIVGGQPSDIERLNPIIIAEGFATTASVSESIGIPAIMAINSGNMELVAKMLHERYPDRLIVIAGDNDLKNELDPDPQKKNVGKIKANEIKEAIGENCIVAIPPVSPEEAKEMSDWNDYALKHGKGSTKALFAKAINEWKKSKGIDGNLSNHLGKTIGGTRNSQSDEVRGNHQPQTAPTQQQKEETAPQKTSNTERKPTPVAENRAPQQAPEIQEKKPIAKEKKTETGYISLIDHSIPLVQAFKELDALKARELVGNGADIREGNDAPFLASCAYCKPETTDWLIKRGADINAQNGLAFYILDERGDKQMIDLVLSYADQIEPQKMDISGTKLIYTALHIAEKYDSSQTEAVRKIVEQAENKVENSTPALALNGNSMTTDDFTEVYQVIANKTIRFDDGVVVPEGTVGGYISDFSTIENANQVWIGEGVVVLGGIKIGEGTRLGGVETTIKNTDDVQVAIIKTANKEKREMSSGTRQRSPNALKQG